MDKNGSKPYRRGYCVVKNSEVTRDQWPMAVVERVFPSADNRVRTVQIRVAKERKSFIRPICELIPLMRE